MTRVEELVAVSATPVQAMRALLTVARAREWTAWDIRITPRRATPVLGVGDRFAIELFGGLTFEYVVEAISDREVVLSYEGPWHGRERWSFVADGAETVVRRSYEVEGGTPLAVLAWGTVGRPVVSAHLRHELARFRSAVEQHPGPRGEIEAGPWRSVEPPGDGDDARRPGGPSFPVDDG